MSLIYGCGTQGQLTGGPRDSIPPKVLKMMPENLQTNFKGDKVEIEFDEYFKLVNEAKEFSVSPEFELQPILKVKKKVLEISFQDTLEKNTTYTLNFGKGIADINESNAIKNFTYVFATGPKLDSLGISGKVTNSTTGLPEIEAVVMIFPKDRDTLFGKKKALIFTTTDSSGNYQLKNLKQDSYKIYAIKEQSSDKIYQQATDEVGFLEAPLVLDTNLRNINLQTFKEEANLFRVVDRKLNDDGSIFMSLNQQLKQPSVKVIEPADLDKDKLVKFNVTNDSLKMWLKDMSFDSTRVVVLDSGKPLDTLKFTRGKKDTYKRVLTATDNLEGNLLNPNRPLKLTFNLPVESVDASKITLTQDSVVKTGLTLEKDTADFLSYYVNYPWLAKRKYEIKFNGGAFAGIFKSTNKEFVKNFELAGKDNYGTLQLKVVTPELKKQYILQVIDENKNLISTSIIQKDTTVKFSNYKAGRYWVRIVYDNNKNGKWDTGNVAKKQQPEKIYNEPKELSIKANWDRNETITIPKEPKTI
ncbi:Ig-like domain-containing protein [Pedobacter immunditicola]|uniref:Ig-like domain-containing protein n=1 Tax=Pedobacter immunditicola TaxID=3133440 RepID=UPI0030A31CAE